LKNPYLFERKIRKFYLLGDAAFLENPVSGKLLHCKKSD